MIAANSTFRKACKLLLSSVCLPSLLAACAGHSVDWAGLGSAAANQTCKNSSHCDLPCSRDAGRPDCVTGTVP